MATKSLCSIPECGKTAFARGWCKAHYLRWFRHGDPEAGGRPKNRRGGRCLIVGCDRPDKTDGLCYSHLYRLRKFGSPFAGPVIGGAPKKYLEGTVISYDGDECLIWPFRRDKAGYARIDGFKTGIVHRIVCEATNGPPPAPGYDAAHSCGKGRFGCVSPNHLSWKTRIDNEADKSAHGTDNSGERNGKAKLVEDDIRAIRSSLESNAFLARYYGVSASNISAIRLRRSWSTIT